MHIANYRSKSKDKEDFPLFECSAAAACLVELLLVAEDWSSCVGQSRFTPNSLSRFAAVVLLALPGTTTGTESITIGICPPSICCETDDGLR